VSDVVIAERIAAIHAADCGVYGARNVHAERGRQGHRVARCTVERRMRSAGLAGITLVLEGCASWPLCGDAWRRHCAPNRRGSDRS